MSHVSCFAKLVISSLQIPSVWRSKGGTATSIARPTFDSRHHHDDQVVSHASDPINLVPGTPVGGLGLEQHTRRRNRVNGHVNSWDAAAGQLTVRVDQVG